MGQECRARVRLVPRVPRSLLVSSIVLLLLLQCQLEDNAGMVQDQPRTVSPEPRVHHHLMATSIVYLNIHCFV